MQREFSTKGLSGSLGAAAVTGAEVHRLRVSSLAPPYQRDLTLFQWVS